MTHPSSHVAPPADDAALKPGMLRERKKFFFIMLIRICRKRECVCLFTCLTLAPLSTVHLLMQTPSSTTTLGPTVTLGPMRQLEPILALGSCN